MATLALGVVAALFLMHEIIIFLWWLSSSMQFVLLQWKSLNYDCCFVAMP
jgi:hypothetical protein